MSETPFHATRMGHTYYERDLPRLIEALQQIAQELQALNAVLQQRGEAGHDRAQS